MVRTDRKVVALLAGGFTLVILLLFASGQRGLEALRELGRGSEGLLSDERAGARALSHVQELETELDRIFYTVPGRHDQLSADAVAERVAMLEAAIRDIAREGVDAAETGDEALWHEFRAAGLAFAQAAMDAGTASWDTAGADRLTRAHGRVREAVHNLAVQADRRNEAFVNRDRDALAAAARESIRLLVLTGGIAITVAIATVLLVRRLLRQLAWQRAELTRLSSDILHTQEATLRQVSHDLHDQIGQTLTAVEANLGALGATSSDWAIRGRVEDCIGLVQDLMAQTRSLSQVLRPSVLDDFGLSASLDALVESFNQRTGLEVTYATTWSGRLEEETETHLYRIAQEALTNIARHSGASTARVALVRDRDTLELTIEDNGRGLPGSAAQATGVGLRSMRARAEQIGGTLVLTNGTYGGLRIVVRSPLHLAKTHEPQDSVAVG